MAETLEVLERSDKSDRLWTINWAILTGQQASEHVGLEGDLGGSNGDKLANQNSPSAACELVSTLQIFSPGVPRISIHPSTQVGGSR
jgi:hypothetical protein